MAYKKKGHEREYMRAYMQHRRSRNDDKHKEIHNAKLTKHRADMKAKAIESKGSVCSVCGCTFDAVCFDFHHEDHTQKDFAVSAILYKSWNEIQSEIEKCVLVCSNCHRVLHKDDSYSHLTNKSAPGEVSQYSLFQGAV